MRVLAIGNMYPPQHLGGYELTWLSSTRDLLAAGHEVRVLTTDVRLSDDATEEHDGVHRELRWYWKDHGWPPQTLRSRMRIERHNAAVLRRHLDDFSPDALAFWAMGGMSLGLIEQVRRAGIPAMGVVGDDWMVYGPEVDAWTRMHRRRPWLRPLAAFAGLPWRFDPGPAAVWLFNSATTRSHAEAAGLTLPRAQVVHPGVEHHLFPPAPTPTTTPCCSPSPGSSRGASCRSRRWRWGCP